MAELIPLPFDRLVRRMMREFDRGAVFDLPRSKFFLGSPDHDLSVSFHGKRASSPLGPAAGPHSQLAQNIALAWLGGSRIFELKTVQILDTLEIPRPCIDMRTVGYNVEWSQELRLEQSLGEYVKAAMLVEMLASRLDLAPGFGNVVYDMSVGYELKGIRSDRVQAFIRGMMDATGTVARLREQIPDEYGALRDLPFPTRLSDTLTLSTFHGCPPDEIERIVDFLLREVGLNCVIKLNPTLLGPDAVDHLLHDVMGYEGIRVPRSAFEKDTTWEQAVGFVERLGATARSLGLGLGVKFTNTLIVEHDGDFLPGSEKEKYLSGQPLHVLAMNLVGRFRERFGDAYPVSFSAGIDKANFADAVALGLTPITVCSDLLQTGGYARLSAYSRNLIARMGELDTRTIDEYIVRSAGLDGDSSPSKLSEAKLINTRVYVERATNDPRYGAAANATPPKKVGSKLELFDCLTCDKCVPVCPNDANFTLTLPPREIPVVTLHPDDDGFRAERSRVMILSKKHQIANFADFCNECGNCDVFCPEDGGPYVLKPRFFGSLDAWRRFNTYDGFYLEREGDTQRVLGRIDGVEYELTVNAGQSEFAGPGFRITCDRANPANTAEGEAEGPIDLTHFYLLDLMREAVFDAEDVNYANAWR